MRKTNLIAAMLAVFMIAGCDLPWAKKNSEEETPAKKWALNPEITGGTEEQKNAILDALNNKPICNQTGSKTSEIFNDVQPTLSEDNGDGIKLTTSQTSGGKTVKLTWTVDESQTYFGARLKSDDAHDLIEIAYKGYGVADGTFSWVLSKLECEEAVANNANIQFSAKIQNEQYKHDEATIAQIYAIHDTELTVDANGTEHKFASTFDIVDYEYHEGKNYSPYFKTNNPDAKEKQYLYYNTPGKVIYTAPDGNWGLLGDGKNVLEFYAGAGKALVQSNWPNLADGYVKLAGNMSQYCGNIQMAFITKVLKLTDAEKAAVTEPADYRVLGEAELAALKVPNYTAAKQAVVMADGGCLSNSLGQITGTLVAGSIKGSDGKDAAVASLVSSKRFTFELKVGENEKIQVAYDYHTDKSGSVGLFNALKAKLQAGGEMTIKGTMRYAGNDSAPFITEGNNGVWSIVPFLTNHVA